MSINGQGYVNFDEETLAISAPDGTPDGDTKPTAAYGVAKLVWMYSDPEDTPFTLLGQWHQDDIDNHEISAAVAWLDLLGGLTPNVGDGQYWMDTKILAVSLRCPASEFQPCIQYPPASSGSSNGNNSADEAPSAPGTGSAPALPDSSGPGPEGGGPTDIHGEWFCAWHSGCECVTRPLTVRPAELCQSARGGFQAQSGGVGQGTK